MTIGKLKQQKLKGISKAASMVPATDMTNSLQDHHRNNMQLAPIEQVLMQNILDELKIIRELMERSSKPPHAKA
jgi:hypothetical protein